MQKIVIDAKASDFKINFKELLPYKDLFFTLAYRDLKVRYAQTFLGLLWAILQPLFTLIVFAVVFGRVAKVDTASVPYPLFAVCGMAAWTYFAFVLNQSGNSIIGSQDMIKKIYFPRLIIPLSKAVLGFVDFAIAILFVIVLLLFFQFTPSTNLIYLPIYGFLVVLSALSIGIWMSALTIRYRDFQHVVPFLVQFGLYATPVGYSGRQVVENLPKWAVYVYYLNPMAGIVEGFRWCILGIDTPSAYSYLSIVLVFFLLITGLLYFKKMEKIMADIV